MEKPQFFHVIIGLGVASIFCFLLLQGFRPFLAEFAAQVLRLGQIAVTKTVEAETPSLFITLTDGSTVSFALTWQSSGLVSIIFFCFLFVLLAFPLKGSLLRKIVFFQLGSLVGLLWCVIRLSVSVLLIYNFGEKAALLTGLVGPFMDFLWVVPIWALGLSSITWAGKRESISKTE